MSRIKVDIEYMMKMVIVRSAKNKYCITKISCMIAMQKLLGVDTTKWTKMPFLDHSNKTALTRC